MTPPSTAQQSVQSPIPAKLLQLKLEQMHEDLIHEVQDIMVLVDQDIRDSIGKGCATTDIAFRHDSYPQAASGCAYSHLHKFRILLRPSARTLLRKELTARKLAFSITGVNVGVVIAYVLTLNWKKQWRPCCCPRAYAWCDDCGCVNECADHGPLVAAFGRVRWFHILHQSEKVYYKACVTSCLTTNLRITW